MKAIELFEHRPILYGSGDFINDYEGIAGCEAFRGDLALMYFVQFDSRTAQCLSLRLVPMQMRRFRLQRASAQDLQWICSFLNQHGNPSGTRLKLTDDKSIELQLDAAGWGG
jgi:poly-gamma-glutamate synthesis protein (capsule biosynthesis protein)